jgi:hypothetical protein
VGVGLHRVQQLGQPVLVVSEELVDPVGQAGEAPLVRSRTSLGAKSRTVPRDCR